MSWFKVDDKLHSHRKTMRAGMPAMGLWAVAGSWCADQLTDGFIPEYAVQRITPDLGLAERLVAAGYWVPATQDGEAGWLFHNWDEFQPTRAQVEAKREDARNRMRRARSHGGDVRANEQANGEGTSRTVTPTPTRPDPTNHPSDGADKPPASRARQMPEDFRPTDAHVALAAELGVDLRAEWPQFVDHHRSRGSTMKDWNAALRTWIRNANRFSRGTAQQQAPVSVYDRPVLPDAPDHIVAAGGKAYTEWLQAQHASAVTQ